MIKIGDNVLIEYNSYFNFPPIYGYNEKFIKAEVISIPRDTGDFWIFKSLEYNLVFYQNPMDSNFVRVYNLEDCNAIEEREITKDNF